MKRFEALGSRFLHSPKRSLALSADPLAEWIDSLRAAPDLRPPDLRWEKVQRVREAIRLDAYEDERIIDLLIERVENDIGVLCRRNER